MDDIDEITFEPEFTEVVENLELKGSIWVYDRNATKGVILYKDLTKDVTRYVEITTKKQSAYNHHKKDLLCYIWCVTAQIDHTNVNQCRTKK